MGRIDWTSPDAWGRIVGSAAAVLLIVVPIWAFVRWGISHEKDVEARRERSSEAESKFDPFVKQCMTECMEFKSKGTKGGRRLHLSESLTRKPGAPGRGKVLPVLMLLDRKPNGPEFPHDSFELFFGLYEDLPEELRAGTPEEVDSVVLVQKSTEQVGQYTGGGGAYRVDLNLVVINLRDKAIIAEQRFRGEEPSLIKQQRESGEGAWPKEEELIGWLKGLR